MTIIILSLCARDRVDDGVQHTNICIPTKQQRTNSYDRKSEGGKDGNKMKTKRIQMRERAQT